MAQLNDTVHFRGEIVTLFATFKVSTSQSTEVLNPSIEIVFATSAGSIETILSKRPMIQIAAERYYFNWTVPDDAPLTVYSAVMSGEIDGEEVKSTEEVIIANPNVTTNRNHLRYGPQSFIQEPRSSEPRIHPQLPIGEF